MTLEIQSRRISKSNSSPVHWDSGTEVIVDDNVHCILLQTATGADLQEQVPVPLNSNTLNQNNIIPNTLKLNTMKPTAISTNKIDIGRNAVVELIILTETRGVRSAFSIGAHSTLIVRRVLRGSENITESISAHLNGEHAVFDSEDIFMRTGGELRITTKVDNIGPQTKAITSMKGTLNGSAKVFLVGNMSIGINAKDSKSDLSQHVLLLSKEAKADALPCLEILNNEVKAGHSASVRPIDPEQLNYLQTRGLSKTEAESIIANGFVSPSLEGLSATAQEAILKIIGRPESLVEAGQ